MANQIVIDSIANNTTKGVEHRVVTASFTSPWIQGMLQPTPNNYSTLLTNIPAGTYSSEIQGRLVGGTDIFNYMGPSVTVVDLPVTPDVPNADFQGFPVINITVPDPSLINHDTKTRGTMEVVNASGTSYSSNQLYSGPIDIKVRGNSTAGAPKTPYSIVTVDSAGADFLVPLFNLPAGSDWALLAEYFDPSELSNDTMLRLGKEIYGTNKWSPGSVKIEVYLNNQYIGLYTFTEKIKRHANRIPIESLSSTNTTLPTISGGYLVQQLAPSQEVPEDQLFTTPIWGGNNAVNQGYGSVIRTFGTEYPKMSDIINRPTQAEYITKQTQAMENAIYNELPEDDVEGYKAYVDIDSWVDYYILKEFSKELDAGTASLYFYKYRGGKFIMGPGWDYDQSFGELVLGPNNNYLQRVEGFYMLGHFWYRKLMTDPFFLQKVYDRLAQVASIIDNRITHTVANAQVIINKGAALRDYSLYQRFTLADTYENEVAKKVAFMRGRLAWMIDAIKTGASGELFNNNLFDRSLSDDTSWEINGTGISISGDGKLRVTNSVLVRPGESQVNNTNQAILFLVPGQEYKLTLVVDSVTDGAVKFTTNQGYNGDFTMNLPPITQAGTYTVNFFANGFTDNYFIAGDERYSSNATFVIDSVSLTPVYKQTSLITSGTLVSPSNSNWSFGSFWINKSTIPMLPAGNSGTAGVKVKGSRIAIGNYPMISYLDGNYNPIDVYLDSTKVGLLTRDNATPLIITGSGAQQLLKLKSGIGTEKTISNFITVLRDDNTPIAEPSGFSGVVGPSTGDPKVVVNYDDARRIRYREGVLTPWGGSGAYGGISVLPYDNASGASYYEETLVHLKVDSVVKYFFASNSGDTRAADRGLFILSVNGEKVSPPVLTNSENTDGVNENRISVVLPAGTYTLKLEKGFSKTGYVQQIEIETI